MTNKNRLEQWRKDRNLTGPSGEIVNMLLEEVKEVEVEVKAKRINKLLGELADVIIIAANEIELMGYDSDKIVEEKIKVISSREQSPAQKEIWSKWGASGKWEKNKYQDKSTIYIADFEKWRK